MRHKSKSCEPIAILDHFQSLEQCMSTSLFVCLSSVCVSVCHLSVFLNWIIWVWEWKNEPDKWQRDCKFGIKCGLQLQFISKLKDSGYFSVMLQCNGDGGGIMVVTSVKACFESGKWTLETRSKWRITHPVPTINYYISPRLATFWENVICHLPVICMSYVCLT